MPNTVFRLSLVPVPIIRLALGEINKERLLVLLLPPPLVEAVG